MEKDGTKKEGRTEGNRKRTEEKYVYKLSQYQCVLSLVPVAQVLDSSTVENGRTVDVDLR